MPIDKAKKRGHRNHFVVGGSSQLADAVRASVKREVEAEFSERIAAAHWAGRWKLRLQMRSEVRRRASTAYARQMPSRESLWYTGATCRNTPPIWGNDVTLRCRTQRS